MKRTVFKRIAAFLLVFSMLPVWAVHSNAICYGTQYDVSATNGWQRCKRQDRVFAHMGQKSTTYYYNIYDMSGLDIYIDEGISMWGNYISCNYVANSNNAMGTIVTRMDTYKDPATNSVAVAYTDIKMNSTTKHIYEWTITICLKEFGELDSPIKSLVMAHEIGHAYGLDHTQVSGKLMSSSTTTMSSITADDRMGMSVMTDTHTHANFYNYERIDSTMKHEQTCSQCHAYGTVNCVIDSSWHSGNKHYYKYNCLCGNKETTSVPCTGNCVDIMEHDDSETE